MTYQAQTSPPASYPSYQIAYRPPVVVTPQVQRPMPRQQVFYLQGSPTQQQRIALSQVTKGRGPNASSLLLRSNSGPLMTKVTPVNSTISNQTSPPNSLLQVSVSSPSRSGPATLSIKPCEIVKSPRSPTPPPSQSVGPLCDYCEKSFGPNLTSHLLKCHLGSLVDNLFTCTVCSKVYQEYKDFEDHCVSTHTTGANLCYICCTNFSSASLLKDHFVTHIGTYAAWKCRFCRNYCASEQSFRVHLEAVHFIGDDFFLKHEPVQPAESIKFEPTEQPIASPFSRSSSPSIKPARSPPSAVSAVSSPSSSTTVSAVSLTSSSVSSPSRTLAPSKVSTSITIKPVFEIMPIIKHKNAR